MSQSNDPPFALTHQLSWGLDQPSGSSSTPRQYLPGYPQISLQDRRTVWDFLSQEFFSDDLDRMADKLWWMSKQDSRNISPLHRQLVKRRTVIITEDPKLHLVWIYDRIFIKPLPRYIMSYAFWQDYLCNDKNNDISKRTRIHRAALGYLRTYYYLSAGVVGHFAGR
ncbi:uncharacterized protein BCR38DRAFT_104995 [Pseudomassariella vexata]|uniref:Uncharacterized protein n=1 Tax=Pseudomassariella vexata TaxID=1141098 RepID=A0A1Y2EGG4_9PEZI|nr:uncharacterized protein BCR38DRAFT_104995 [Pseudomassariella vexata]ORY70346.1 hypothetical protein BCR38DRAFT_104995 [Pseudomassariella vexata]